MNSYDKATVFGIGVALVVLAAVVGVITGRHSARLDALESKATAPVENPLYVGEFAAERIAGRVRTHCEWKERTE